MPDDRLLVARVVIEEWLDEDGDELHAVEAVDAGGDGLPIVQVLGMLRLAEDSLIRQSMNDDDEESTAPPE